MIALILEGQQHDLPALRELFSRHGLRSFQRSAWVGARTTDDRLGPALQHAGFADSVVVFHCDDVDIPTRQRLAQMWRLDERSADLRAFHQLIFDYVHAAGDDRVEAAWRCVEVTPVWYRVAILEEPPFPLDLLDADYPLEGLRSGWRAHLEVMTDSLLELWGTNPRRPRRHRPIRKQASS